VGIAGRERSFQPGYVREVHTSIKLGPGLKNGSAVRPPNGQPRSIDADCLTISPPLNLTNDTTMNTSKHILNNAKPNALQLLADEPEWAAVLGDSPAAVGFTEAGLQGLAFEVLGYLTEGTGSDLASPLGLAVLQDLRGDSGTGWGFALAVRTGGLALQRWAADYMSMGAFEGFAITAVMGCDDWVSEVLRRVSEIDSSAEYAEDEPEAGGMAGIGVTWV
jgi:hypothetical protein